MPGEPELLLPAEAAAYLRCSERAVLHLLDGGKLPHVRPGKRRLIRRVDLVAFVNGTSSAPVATVESTAPAATVTSPILQLAAQRKARRAAGGR